MKEREEAWEKIEKMALDNPEVCACVCVCAHDGGKGIYVQSLYICVEYDISLDYIMCVMQCYDM